MFFPVYKPSLVKTCDYSGNRKNAFPDLQNPVAGCERSGPGGVVDIQPKFAGVTNNLQGKHWVSGENLRAILHLSPTPYIGRLPRVFVESAAGGTPKQIFQGFDELGRLLQGVSDMEGVTFEFNIGPSQTPYQMTSVGAGAFGSVYRLLVDGQPYALKIYHSSKLDYDHGSYEESATGLYFSKNQYRDLAGFYFGNPVAGWSVFEFIPEDMTHDSREGELFSALDVELGDGGEPNEINGIRVDYGGIARRTKAVIRDFDDYQTALGSEDIRTQVQAVSQISLLPEEFRLGAYRLAMDTGNPYVQAEAVSELSSLQEEYRETVFLEAIETGDAMIQAVAASQIFALPLDLRNIAFEWAMATGDPAIQANAAKQIRYLPEDVFVDAYKSAFATGDTNVQAAAAAYTGDLSDSFQREAFRLAMETGKPDVYSQMAMNIRSFCPELAGTAFKQLLETKDPETLNQLSYQLSYLQLEKREEMYFLLLNSNDPNVMYRLAWQLPKLPEGRRKEAFDILWNTKTPRIQQVLGYQVSVLPEDEKIQMYKQLMAVQDPQAQDHKVQRNVTTTIGALPADFRYEAFCIAMEKDEPAILNAAAEQIHLLPKAHIPEAYKAAIATGLPSVQVAAFSLLMKLPADFREEAIALFMEAREKEHPFRYVRNLKIKLGQGENRS